MRLHRQRVESISNVATRISRRARETSRRGCSTPTCRTPSPISRDWPRAPRNGPIRGPGKKAHAAAISTARVFHRVIDGFMIQGGDPLGPGHRRSRLHVRGRVLTQAASRQGRPAVDGQPRSQHQRRTVLHHARADAVARQQAQRLRRRSSTGWTSSRRSAAPRRASPAIGRSSRSPFRRYGLKRPDARCSTLHVARCTLHVARSTVRCAK